MKTPKQQGFFSSLLGGSQFYEYLKEAKELGAFDKYEAEHESN